MTRRWIGAWVVLAGAAALPACSSDWQTRAEQLERENLDLAAELEGVRTSSATAQAALEAKDAERRALEREQQRLREEREAAIRAAQEWQARAEKPVAPAATAGAKRADTPADSLRRSYDGQVNTRENGDVAITLTSDVGFTSGSDVLSDAAKKSLRGLASKLNGEFGACQIVVEGHTDTDPLVRTKAKYGDNMGLSRARAASVAQFLQGDLKIDASRVTTVGFGETRPVADNKSAAGKAKNRRVEIVVVTSAQGR